MKNKNIDDDHFSPLNIHTPASLLNEFNGIIINALNSNFNGKNMYIRGIYKPNKK